MELLDDKVLTKILRLVPQERKLFLVCKQWYELLDNAVGIKVAIGETTVERLFYSGESNDSMKILEKVGIRSCEVYCLLNDTASLLKLKNPDLLEFISFRNFVSSQSFTSILTGVKNLYKFEIDLDAIYHLEFSDIEFSLPCQVLRIYFKLGDNTFYPEQKFSYRCYRKESEYEVLNINTIYFFRHSFPGLKKIDVQLVILESPYMYDWLTNELVNFLCKHSGALTELDICMWENKDVTYDYEYNFQLTPSEAQSIQAAQFQNLRRISVVDLSNSCQKTFDWMGWAMKMPNLKTPNPNINISKIRLHSPIFQKNQAFITRIFIDLSCRLLKTFDCVIFKYCHKLTDLQISADACSRFKPHDEDFYEGLLNADQLPKSILRLHISGLAITCESCEVLCLQLPALERLELIGNVDSNGYGVTRDVTEKIIQQKKIQRFDFEIGTQLSQSSTAGVLDQVYELTTRYRRIIGNLETNGEYIFKLSTSERTLFLPI